MKINLCDSALSDEQNFTSEILIILVSADIPATELNGYSDAFKQSLRYYQKIGDWHKESKYLLIVDSHINKARPTLLVNANENSSTKEIKAASRSIIEQMQRLQQPSADLFITKEFTQYSVLFDSLFHASYQFNQFKSKPNDFAVKSISVHQEETRGSEQLNISQAAHTGLCITRNLANMPGNICTPTYLAARAAELAQNYPTISTEVLTEEQLDELGMGAYTAVGRGSAQPTCMPVMNYRCGNNDAPAICIIGKGITFDTGGITLKKPPGMQNMIYDMCGAATVIGLMATIAELKLPLNVTGIVATAENMPDGNAFRPGDVLTTMSGQTVEVISTDAEGRLVLCDAMTYAKQFTPDLIIDIATLTGAQIVSLGTHASGLMGNSPALNKALQEAGEQAGDRAWTMPIWPDYQEALDSPVADMRNSGSNSPGMLTAGCYLSRFAGDTPWAHIDIAGTSFQYGSGNSATGRPLPLLLQFLRNYSNKPGIEWSTDMDASALLT